MKSMQDSEIFLEVRVTEIFFEVKRGRLLNRSCSLGMVSAQIWFIVRFGDVNPIRVQTSSLLLHFVSTLQMRVRIVRVLRNVERDLELKRVKVTARTPTQPGKELESYFVRVEEV